MGASRGITCRELVELVTAYLDGALPSAERARSDEHFRTCAGCRAYRAQMEAVVETLGHLHREQRDDRADKARLLHLFRTRGLHSRAPRERSVPLGIADAFAAPGDHIGYFWEQEHELDATAGFLAAGLERDEMCVLLAHDAASARVLAGLARRGFPPDAFHRRHRFHTVSGQQPTDAILGDLGDRIRTAIADDGVPMVRILGHLGWERPGWPAERDILSLEARVTDAVRNLPSVIVCAYDVRRLSGRQLLLGGLECHPFTLRHGALRHNEHHVAAQPFLERLAVDA